MSAFGTKRTSIAAGSGAPKEPPLPFDVNQCEFAVRGHLFFTLFTAWEAKMKKLALIVLAGASLVGTGIASAQYSFGDEGYWQR